MTPRFLFPATRVTENPSVRTRCLNYFFHRASHLSPVHWISQLSHYPITLTWNILETWTAACLTFGGQSSPRGCPRRSRGSPRPRRTPGDAPHGSAFPSQCHGQHQEQGLTLTARGTVDCHPTHVCSGDRQGRANAPVSKGAGCNSAGLVGGNVFSFSKYIPAQCLCWLRGQWRCSKITTTIILHNLFQIHQKYLYFFFRSMGFGTRNRITDLPLNSTALLRQKKPAHCYTKLCNWFWCTAKFTKH